MARYFFVLVARTIIIPDPHGEEWATLEEAKAAAIQAAHDLAVGKLPAQVSGHRIVVQDETGVQLFEAPLRII
ncbi:MAG: DUF6894 family protein [Xanthobacteraceae bacterium]